MRKILIIVDSLNPNHGSGAKANLAIIENLLDLGLDITVISFGVSQRHLVGYTQINFKISKLNLYYFISRFTRIVRRNFGCNLNVYFENKFGFSATFLNEIYSFKKLLSKINLNNFNKILTLSQGASYQPHFLLNYFPTSHSKWIAFFHDPYPFSAYPDPYKWNEPGFRIKEFYFNQILSRPRWKVFPSLLLKQAMAKYYRFNISDTYIIPHQVMNGMQIQSKNNLNDIFVIRHIGNLMNTRSPMGLILGFMDFCNKLNLNVNHTRLELYGNISFYQNQISLIKPPKNVILHDNNLHFETAQDLLKTASINVIIEADSCESPFLPLKFSYCLSARRPILYLGPERSECMRLMGQNYPYATTILNKNKISSLLCELYKINYQELGNKLYSRELLNYLSKENFSCQLNNILTVN